MSAISLTNFSSSLPTTSTPNYFKERRADLEQLNQALKSGDLVSAQQDYNNLVTLGKNDLQRNHPFSAPTGDRISTKSEPRFRTET